MAMPDPQWFTEAVEAMVRIERDDCERWLIAVYGKRPHEARNEVGQALAGKECPAFHRLLRAALPALLDGLCPEEPTEEELEAATNAWWGRKGLDVYDNPLDLVVRAVIRARRERIERELEGTSD
jgi:hypothetical protein